MGRIERLGAGFLALQFADVISTIYGVSIGRKELNPFATYFIDRGTLWALVLLKMALALMIVSFLARKGGRLAIVSLLILDLLSLAVVINNMWRLIHG